MAQLQTMKGVAKHFLHALGLEVHRVGTRPRFTIGEVLANAAKMCWTPKTIIDVGVADGTPGLYDTFTGAQIVLVEPLVEFKPAMERLCRRYKADYVLAAASDSIGEVIIHTHEILSGSSTLRETESGQVDGIARTVPTLRLDTLCKGKNYDGPYLIKVDVQGAELSVLEGAEGILEDTGMVLLEVSLMPFFVNGPELAELVVFMKDRGFVTYDIFGGHTRPFDGALAQMDMAFVKDDGPFRAFRGYATVEQRAALTQTWRAQQDAVLGEHHHPVSGSLAWRRGISLAFAHGLRFSIPSSPIVGRSALGVVKLPEGSDPGTHSATLAHLALEREHQ
jgi:FkbM family methyltransferase